MDAQSLQPRLINSILAIVCYVLYNPAIQIAVARVLS